MMIKLEYDKFLKKELKERNFLIDTEYIKIFRKQFQVRKEKVIREEFCHNKKNIFEDETKKSLTEVFHKYKELKIDEFDIIFENKNLIDILTLNTTDIVQLIKKEGDKTHLSKLKYCFNYDKFQKEITDFFQNNFNFKTCFYCNKDFITNFKKEKNKLVSTFQLDHFYDKGTYPYLALSFYNLIPSCSICNSSKVKGSRDCLKHDDKVGSYAEETCIIPNSNDFKFDEKVKFKLFLSNKCKNLHIKDKTSIEIPLKESYTDEYSKYIKVFELDERYKIHKDIVYEMITKAELYPLSRLKELQNLTGIPFKQIKKDIFNLIDKDADLSKKPFSKLIVDISEELGLL